MRPTRSCELYIDGASRGNPGPAGVGVVLTDGEATPVDQFGRFIGETTNNVAEYLALVYGLAAALRRGCAEVLVHTDSELLARQIDGRYRVRDAQLRLLHDLSRFLMSQFTACRVVHIPRARNAAADRLAGRAADARAAC